MALLRNRKVTVVGPNGAEVSPIYTVQYPDGTKEDTPLKFIHMTEAEHKEFKKTSPTHADQVRVIDDKEHQEVVDSQDVKKIKDKQSKPQPAQAQTPDQVRKNTIDNTSYRVR